MRVAFDHQIFTAQRYGGISRYFSELPGRMPKDLVAEVAVIAPLHVNYYLSQPRVRQFVRGCYIPFDFRGQTRIVSLVNGIAAPVTWRRMRADIAHETYFSVEPVGVARRRVVTVYDMIYELFPNEFSHSEEVIEAKRAAIVRADHVICISEATRRDLVSFYNVESSRTTVIHLGHSSMDGHEPPTGSMVAQGRKRTILYVGNRGGYKNFSRLAAAYASSPHLRSEFEVLAFGGPPFSAEEVAEFERFGVRDRMRQRGGSDRDLRSCYENAAVFVCPSLYEGFGIPVVEAMAYGCPVISSDRGSLPEVVGDAGVYFDPESIDDIRAVLERVSADAALQQQLRQRGRERAEAFSWDRCAAQTAAVYRAVQ
jgi:glycosyltransferase involved in cell wall biosynthesis